ncbi:MAG: cytochrome c family protein [Pseudomonadales bacterium]|nr:cytochrome c family protein [Pseudomonadales bacterium]
MDKLGWIGVSSLVVAVILVGLAALSYRTDALQERPMLSVIFGHKDHEEITCTKCHHNFIDDSGSGTCYSCHKYSPEINAEIERMFHDLCRDCHVATRQEGEAAGPLRSCDQCHDATLKSD